ncbi:MAG TPA: Fe-S cluster assembly protein SufD [Chloroflexota bacterium]|jgi:Fe-S cluster assembly protein SufD
MVTTEHKIELTSYRADFERLAQAPAGREPAWLRARRQTAFERFAATGFPTTRQEDWKYTNVAPIARQPYHLAAAAPDVVTPAALAPFRFSEPGWPELVFVDGHYAPALSSLAGLPDGVRVASLAEVLAADEGLINEYLGQHATHLASGFTALNLAFLHDGALVSLPNGRIVDAPIHLLFVSTARDPLAATHPRVLVVLGRASAATVVESYVALGDGPYLTNAVSELVLGEGANLAHYKVLRESLAAYHVGTTEVYQPRDSVFVSFSIALGAQLARNDLNVLLDAEGADSTLNGLYLVDGTRHVDNHTAIDHARPHGTSRELYKGILDGHSRGVFNGKVVVRPDAQKTDARQTNRNILLSEDATIDTKPQLEIFADDVKCAHGAAVGQLDPQAVFYLRSRGLSPEAARRLLTYGFASDITSQIKIEPLRAQLDALLLATVQTGSLAKESS